jgi:large subunit ribosomal protein LP0
MASKKSKDRKYELAEELEAHFAEYSKLFLVTVDNVGSNQLHEIRKSLRGTAVIYCGKNTQIRRVIRKLAVDRPELDALVARMKLNVALVFTHGDLSTVKDAIESNKMPSAAKAGALAQCDLTLEKGVTSLEPSQTSFLQALNIGTKITKGQIEIINDTPILHKGVRVDASQAALLQKLNILPFAYGLIVVGVYDNGSVFEPAVLAISNADILAQFNAGVRNVAAVSLALNTPTIVSVPYSILLAFRNMLAICCETDATFKGAEDVKKYLKDPSAFAFAAGPATSGGAAPAAAAKKKKTTTEEEEMAPAAGLFDGGDDY